jgi:8-oxo-dGTP diphosphatase
MRVVFHGQDDAEAVAALLRADGFAADVARERFANEDDDEDHAWAVTTDAPAVAAELLAEQHDGWPDQDDPAARPTAASDVHLELPSAPRRVKGHFTD